ncbi:MAG: MFS transporter [Thermaerobacter sp.]|nr:MFS transporter [Thermaerobacter sp.]
MPRRYWILTLLTVAYFVNYLDRGAISVAIPFIGRDLSLDHTQMGLAMSAFFLGFVLLELPAGWLADRIGCRVLVPAGILWWSVFSFLTGTVGSLGSLLAVRVAFGLGEGIYPPTSLKALSLWMPRRERARANGIMLAATNLGLAVSVLLGAGIIYLWGWRALFYLIALPGAVVAWLLYRYYRDPAPCGQKRTGSLGQLVRLPAVWVWSVAWLAMFIAFWGLSSWLPTYLLQGRHFPLAVMGVVGSVPYVLGVVGMLLGGYLSDRLRRRAVTIVPALGLGAVAIGLGYLLPGFWPALLGFGLGNLCISMVPSPFYSLPMDSLPPEQVGAALGLVNSVGMLSGLLAPTLIGYTIDRTGGFGGGFLIIVGSLVLSAVLVLAVRERRLIWPAAREAFGPASGWPSLPADWPRLAPCDGGLPCDGALEH